MSKYGSDDVAFFLIDGYSVLGSTTEIADDKEAILEETDPLGASWVEKESTGLKRGEITQNGFFDDATDGINDALSEQQGLSRILSYGIEGNLKAKQFIGFAGGMQINYNRITSRGELHKANAKYLSSGAVEDGHILHELAIVTAAGDTESLAVDAGTQADPVTITSSSVDNPTVITTAAPHLLLTGDGILIAGHSGSTPDINGVHIVTVLTADTFTIPIQVTVGGTGGTSTRISSRDGGAGYLQLPVLTLGGYDNLIINLRHSQDDITYATKATFTAVTTSPTAERKTFTGILYRYTAMSWAWTGSGSAQTATFMVGVIRN